MNEKYKTNKLISIMSNLIKGDKHGKQAGRDNTHSNTILQTKMLAPYFFKTFTLIHRSVKGGEKVLIAISILIGIDIATGILNAILQKKLTSKRSYIGMFKKVSIMAVIIVAFIVEDHLHITGAVEMVTTFFIVTESLSILENLKSIGIPIPDFLSKLINTKGGDEDK